MRIRWLRNLKHAWSGFVTVFVVPVFVTASQRSWWRLLLLVVGCLLMLWWTRAGEDLLCDGHAVQDQICEEFSSRHISGNLCYDLCVTKMYQLSGCGGPAQHSRVKTFQVVKKGVLLQDTRAMVSETLPNLQPGLPYRDFKALVVTVLFDHLDTTPEMDVLANQLLDDFDFNRNARLSYGEAQTLWRQIHQPTFLNRYMFKASGVFGHLNGSCGSVSVWHQAEGAPHLYNDHALGFLSFLYPKIYRLALPTWTKKAKIVLGLLELAEDLMEMFGARFHLCNVSGSSLFYNKHGDILISDDAQLMSSQQIKRSLSNRSCHHNHDCVFSKQCHAKCHISTQTCTGQLIRPTVAHICDIIQDYLVFDAPKTIKGTLARRVRQCQHLMSSTSHHYLVKHSVLVLDIKAVLWRYIQDLKL